MTDRIETLYEMCFLNKIDLSNKTLMSADKRSLISKKDEKDGSIFIND